MSAPKTTYECMEWQLADRFKKFWLENKNDRIWCECRADEATHLSNALLLNFMNGRKIAAVGRVILIADGPVVWVENHE